MSYNGSGTFQINTSGQPVVAGTVISSTAFNALTADLATGLSTAITKDGQSTTTVRIPFAAGINSSLATDSTGTTTGSIITAGGIGIAKALYVGTNANIAGTLGVTGVATFSAAPIYTSLTASSAVATDASKALVSVTNTGTGNNVLANSPTLVTPILGTPQSGTVTNLTGTASININGTVGATTANTGAFTSLTASTTLGVTGVATFSAGTAALPAITTTGDTNTGIFFPAADTIAFSEGGVESVRINSSGRVLIGSTSSVGNANANNLEITNSAGSGVCGLTFNVASASANTGNIYWRSNASNNAIQLVGDPITNYFAIATSGSERMRIDSSGNVGIGTSSPAANSVTIASKNAVMTTGYGMSWNSGATQLAGYDTNILQFITASTERMRIDSSGRVGIGSSSPNTSATLTLKQAASAYQIQLEQSNVATAGYGLRCDGGDGDLSFSRYETSAYTERMRLTAAGNLGIGATPATILDVYKASGNPYIRVYTGTGSVQGYIQAIDSTYVKIGSLSSHDLGLVTGGTEAVRITTGGNVGIGTSSPNASAILDAQSTTKGVRFPNMTTTQKNAISSPAAGLVVFDTTLSKLAVYSGAAWQTITSV